MRWIVQIWQPRSWSRKAIPLSGFSTVATLNGRRSSHSRSVRSRSGVDFVGAPGFSGASQLHGKSVLNLPEQEDVLFLPENPLFCGIRPWTCSTFVCMSEAGGGAETLNCCGSWLDQGVCTLEVDIAGVSAN